MMFKDRVHQVVRYENIDDLAAKLINHTWTLCTGFEYEGVLFLNDSTSEDGAQEYAVVIPDSGRRSGVQVESITFGWVKELSTAKGYIEECLGYKRAIEAAPMRLSVVLHLDHPYERCHLCR